MLNRLQRVRQMSAAEWSWRAQTTARTFAQTIAVGMRPPRWDRRRIADALAPSVLDARARAAVARGDWQYLQDTLTLGIRSRPSRFPLDPAACREVTSAVLARWPDAAANAASQANEILKGSYNLLGYRELAFAPRGQEVDWHFDPVHNRRAPRVAWPKVPYLNPEFGDHKVIWEINRHQHWLQLGRALWLTGGTRYAAGVVRLLESWLAANPPLVGINWASMLEIGFRSISWTWTMHALLAVSGSETQPGSVDAPRSPWLVDMLVALDRQLTHVEQNLSYYFSPNTHLTGEALALYVVGSALPELRASGRWVQTGRRVLLDEIDRQVLPDGGHAERSMHYQRYTLDFYLLALMTAVQTGDLEAVPRLRSAATRLAEFTLALADDRGRLPLIGDDDGGMLWPIAGRDCQDVRDSLALAAIVLSRPDLARWGLAEEAFWVAGRLAVERAASIESHVTESRAIESRTFADTGYVVMRDHAGGHAVLDAGAHGYMNGGHAHADALALTLTLRTRPFLIDPGTSTYTMDGRLRDRMRSSMSHNTVAIDGRSQAVASGPFHWRTRADARVEISRHNPCFDWVEAAHDAYAPLTHRRSVFRSAASGWLVVDDIAGRGGPHLAATHWHLDPAWMLKADGPGRVCARHMDGDVAWLLHDGQETRLVHGDEESGLGWFAPAYGTLLPTWTAVVARDGVAPFTMLTWIGEGAPGEVPSLARIASAGDTGAAITAAAVSAGDVLSVFLVRGRGASGICSVADYRTDARALHYKARGDRVRVIEMVDALGSHSMRDDGISLIAADRVADLHLSLDDSGVAALWASVPPSELRLEGGGLAAVRGIRLNGRDVRLETTSGNERFVLRGGDWGDLAPSGAPRTDKTVTQGASLPT
jgi:uncharacterized heparinase superfamily protein